MPRVRKTTQQATAKHWKLGIYIRLSREDKEEEEKAKKKNSRRNVDENASGSIVEQDKILTEWVEEYFREESYEIIDYFVDDGLTGTDDTRDDFQRLIECVETGRVNCIVVKTLSRAFRNYADQGRYLEQVFPRLGVRFISSGNPFVDSFNDPDAISSGMEIPINGLMNDRYAAKTSADIRRTFDAKRRRGEFIGGFAPHGYVKDPDDKNSLIIDEEAAQHIRDIFNWFVVDGMSKRGIAVKLNELGILNPTAYKQRVLKLNYKNPHAKLNDGLWSSNNILNILKNEVYIGNMVQGRNRVISYKVHTQVRVPEEEWYLVEDTHEAIISRELFEKAQLLHSRDTKTAPGKKKLYIFAGLLRCADCKKALRRKSSKGHTYYHCRTVVDKGGCTKRSIREEKLIQAVFDAIHIQIELVKSLSDALEDINKRPNVKTQSNRLTAMLKLRVTDLDRIITASDGLFIDWKNKDVSNEDYRRMKASFDEKAETLRAAIDNIKDEINTLARGVNENDPSKIDEYNSAKELQNGHEDDLKREIDGILSQFPDKIEISEVREYVHTSVTASKISRKHIFGENPDDEECISYILEIWLTDKIVGRKELEDEFEYRERVREIIRSCINGEVYNEDTDNIYSLLNSSSNETEALINALSGGYIPSGESGMPDENGNKNIRRSSGNIWGGS